MFRENKREKRGAEEKLNDASKQLKNSLDGRTDRQCFCDYTVRARKKRCPECKQKKREERKIKRRGDDKWTHKRSG